MALYKEKTVNWEVCNYWMITEYNWCKEKNQTKIVIWLYKDIWSRANDINDIIERDVRFIDWSDYSISELYSKIKESQLVDVSVPRNPTMEMRTDIEYDIVKAERNFLVDAVDC